MRDCHDSLVGLHRTRDHVGMAELVLVRGDVTLQETDAIVNAANAGLAEGAGVCGAVFAAAGRSDLAAACRAIGRCPVGDACTTPGYGLRARWIIHAVGPQWSGGHSGEAELLAGAYRAVLREADAIGARSLATPILSSGIFGYPLDDACRIAVETLRDTPSSADEIRLVAFDERTEQVLARLLPG